MAIQIERQGRVVVVRLNRPQVLNALNSEMMHEMVRAMQELDHDPKVGCFVLTGNDKAFAAGADIKELASKSYMDMVPRGFLLRPGISFTALRRPKIAAVAGYALGGGCELAMMCDMIFRGRHSQVRPARNQAWADTRHGWISATDQACGQGQGDGYAADRAHDGRGGSRARRTGRPCHPGRGASWRKRWQPRKRSPGYGRTAIMAAREAVERALEGSLREGILFERRTYYALWATADANEGMRAFIEKRPPEFTGR